MVGHEENALYPQAKAHVVECSACKQPGFLDTWPHIVSSRNTEARELLLGGKLFKYTCPVCGATTTLAYDCAYQDTARRVVLFYTPNRGDEATYRTRLDDLAAAAQHQEGPDAQPYQKRLVFTTFEFCEKARLLAEGYDDRIIELMKVAIKRGMLKEGIVGPRDILIYERTLEDGSVSFVVTGEIPGDTVGVVQGYTYLRDTWTEEVDQISDEYSFGPAWANKFLP